MRRVAVLFALLVSASLCWGHGLSDRVPDARELADLEAKAATASPTNNRISMPSWCTR